MVIGPVVELIVCDLLVLEGLQDKSPYGMNRRTAAIVQVGLVVPGPGSPGFLPASGRQHSGTWCCWNRRPHANPADITNIESWFALFQYVVDAPGTSIARRGRMCTRIA